MKINASRSAWRDAHLRSQDFLRKVWRDKIVFRKLNLAKSGRVPVGPNAVIEDDLGFTRSA